MIGQISTTITDNPRGILYMLLCILLSTYYLFLKCRRDPRLVEFAKTIDGPDGLPLVGNSLQFVFGGIVAFGKTCATYSKKYGSVYKLWLGKELLIGLSEIDHVKVVLRSPKTLGKPKNLFCAFEDFWGNALFTIATPEWRKTRKKLQPIFGRNIMKLQISAINKSIDIYEKLFENHLNGPEFNVYEYIPHLVVQAFLNSFIGVNLTFDETKYFSFHTILKESGIDALQAVIQPWRRMKFMRKLAGSKTDIFKNTLQEFFASFIEKTSITKEDDHFEEKRSDNPTDFLITTVQNLEKEMKLKDYSYQETMGMIAASTDTTSTITAYCLLMIAMHPEIQKKLNEERCQVFGVDGVPSTMEELDECKYLDQVLRETLRRFTIVPFIFRNADEDIDLGSMVVPAGTAIMVRVEDIHHNPQIYPNPTVFNPDNFSPEAVSQRSKCSFLAFGTGSRDCIGRVFAESVMKLTILTFLRKFKLNTTTKMEDIEYEPGFIVGKRGGYQLSITSRY